MLGVPSYWHRSESLSRVAAFSLELSGDSKLGSIWNYVDLAFYSVITGILIDTDHLFFLRSHFNKAI